MKEYKDVIKWTGDNNNLVLDFLYKHRLDLGLKHNIVLEIDSDKTLLIKNLDMKIEKNYYIIINIDNKIGIRSEKEIRGLYI